MSNEQIKLRELENNVRISGVLKEVNLEVKPNKKEPNVKQIMGNIVVMVEKDGKIHEHEVNLFAKETGKLYKGYVTIMNEYKSAEAFGKDNADLVTVQGSLDENRYMGSDGTVKRFNRIRGLFVNRVDALPQHEAIAQLEIVVQSISPREIVVGDQVEVTDEYNISGLTVGYNNTVNKIHDMIVPANLADVINENYTSGQTGKLTFEIQNYVEVTETKQEPLAAEGGFGVQVDISNTAKKYVRRLHLIGGFPPYFDERAASEDDVRLMNQIINLSIDELKNSVPATPQTQTAPGGFGVNNSGSTAPDPFSVAPQISEDDLPF